LVLCETTGSVARADITINLIDVGTTLNSLGVAWALALTVGSNKADIALANANRNLASGLDEAFTVASADLALEHWACNVAGLASKWLLALTASTIGHLFIITHTGSTVSTTAGKV